MRCSRAVPPIHCVGPCGSTRWNSDCVPCCRLHSPPTPGLRTSMAPSSFSSSIRRSGMPACGLPPPNSSTQPDPSGWNAVRSSSRPRHPRYGRIPRRRAVPCRCRRPHAKRCRPHWRRSMPRMERKRTGPECPLAIRDLRSGPQRRGHATGRNHRKR